MNTETILIYQKTYILMLPFNDFIDQRNNTSMAVKGLK